jgi:two-component system nitrogen regulation response regulator GlnG
MPHASATIIVADDDAGIRTVLQQALARQGYLVRTTGNAATLWRWASAGEGDLVITDVIMPDENAFALIPKLKALRPDLPVIVMSAQNTLTTAITAAEKGAYEYLPKPFDLHELTGVVRRALTAKTSQKAAADDSDGPHDILIGRSAAMQDVYRVLARLTPTDLTVMISGESGTGKELAARALHEYGKRRAGPFVPVSMAAIPKELIESELFGHEKGAFTGAANRSAGRFEQAEGGTLFLDEIGDMPLDAQTRLLRVLQEGEFTTVGGRTKIKTNVRIVAATNRDLRQLIHQGRFREDLYYRLNVVPLRLPPLRARAEDIPDLARHFLSRIESEGLPRKSFEPGALDVLKRHKWPGNVRELENLIRRLTALYNDDTISAAAVAAELQEPFDGPAEAPPDTATLSDDIQKHVSHIFSGSPGGVPANGLYDRILREVEKPLILQCLRVTRGNQIRAAEILGLNRNTLRKKIRDLDIAVLRGLK